jgi:hypothetical protein
MTASDDTDRMNGSGPTANSPSRRRLIAAALRSVWAGAGDSQTADPDLLPAGLARAAVDVLGVDGAGLSLYESDFRVPLGASNEMTTLAERLQFTQGQGPCLTAARERWLLVSDSEQLQQVWPQYCDELFRHTPFRAIIALPLVVTGKAFGALDLFLTDQDRLEAVSLADAVTVTEQVRDVLSATQAITESDPDPGTEMTPMWLNTTSAHGRAQVWIAIGMLMARFRLSNADALALLRSYAYGHDTVLDETAAAIVARTLNIDAMQP